MSPKASVQLYTLREQFAADMQGSLNRLAEIGLKHTEAFAFVDEPKKIREALDNAGLDAPTGHAPLLSEALWTPDGSTPTAGNEVVFEAANMIGMECVIDPFVAPEHWLTEDAVKSLADRLNQAAELASTYGLTVGYHNHAQEFIADFDGVSAYERFVELLDPRVRLELDLYWALVGGQDVPALVERLGERLFAIHVKDGIAPAENPWAEGASPSSSEELEQVRPGDGEVPLDASLKAATSLQWAVIEYDHAPGDVFEDITASYRYLIDGGFAA